jgi:iron complex outermembrane receptor protein
LGNGWTIDDKVYTMRYYNKQNYNGVTSITTTSATDKLNSYWKVGNNIPITKATSTGVFRTGLWTEYASTDRYQAPSDPRTWIDAPLPNFHEMFGTTTLQPYAEYGWRATPSLTVTPGVKYVLLSRTSRSCRQRQDRRKPQRRALHAARGRLPHVAAVNRRALSRAAALVDLRQHGKGQNVPPTSIRREGALVATLPKPILTDTVQVGSVWKSGRATLDVDYYHIGFQNDYSSSIDPVMERRCISSRATRRHRASRPRARCPWVWLGGLLERHAGTAKHNDTARGAERTQGHGNDGVTHKHGQLNVGLFNKRVGEMWQDNNAAHQAVAIDPPTSRTCS